LTFAGLIPALGRLGYGYQTAAITPAILILSDLLSHLGEGLVVPRLVDSLIGCAIALVAGYLLWPESWHTRVGDRLASAVADTAGYVEHTFSGSRDLTGGARGAQIRRRLYRDLSAIRTEFQRALTEPPPNGPRAAAWWPLIVAVERLVDVTTAARVHIRHGAPLPAEEEVRGVTRELRSLSEAVLQSRGPRGERPVRDDAPVSLLSPLLVEVQAAWRESDARHCPAPIEARGA
jgi:uncharacterized membrane protein YccC